MTATATIAERARENAIQLEVKKDGLQQRQNGDWVLRFTVQSIDMDDRITRAQMGTRFVCALVEIGDDETPIGGEAQGHAGHMAILPPASVTRTGGPPIKERRSFDTLLPAQQAGIWCSEPAFWKFLEEKYPTAWKHYSASRNRYSTDSEFVTTDMVAAGTVRHLCGVNSRGSIKPDNPAWRLIVDSYPIWKRT